MVLKSVDNPHYYKNARVDAIVYPGDLRKINSIKDSVKESRYKLRGLDLTKTGIFDTYDLLLAHLLLGEAVVWGNEFKDLLKAILNIKADYYVIVDFKEDPVVDYEYLETYLAENNYEIIAKEEINKKQPQEFESFIGKTYIGYLIKKK